MRIAFYAPLKPPDHPTPSGDRTVARLFLAALQRGGHTPFLASRLRSYDGVGDPRRQARLAALAGREAGRLLRHFARRPETAPDLWFTYHLYHKAPDWLGPAVAGALAIPYVVAEASDAAKRAVGPWAAGHAAARHAIACADAVIGLNPADRDGVLPLLADPSRWVALKPFVDAAFWRQPPRAVRPRPPRLITLAMMRPGDKLASYRVLGAALSQLRDLDWSLEVVGDGPAHSAVERALAPIADRVVWSRALDDAAAVLRLAASDLCLWPAINEAYGMALLEAQASGLPVVAGASGGVGAIVVSEVTGLLVPPGNIAAFAAAASRLIRDPARRAAFSAAALRHVAAEHDIAAAARNLNGVFGRLLPADGGSSPLWTAA